MHLHEMYDSESGRSNGIDSIKNNAPSAVIEDQTEVIAQ
jgi:uncharacterized protein YegP (UPF0339 family)